MLVSYRASVVCSKKRLQLVRSASGRGNSIESAENAV